MTTTTSGITTPALRVKRNNGKNRNHTNTVQTGDNDRDKKHVKDHNFVDKLAERTPNRVGRWFDQDSLNISANCSGQNKS